jgi:hypothetical protein
LRKTMRKPSRHVQFCSSPTHSVHRSEYGVQPYSEVYGMHPRAFDFDEFGNKMPRTSQRTMLHPGADSDSEAYRSRDCGSDSPWRTDRSDRYMSAAAHSSGSHSHSSDSFSYNRGYGHDCDDLFG